MKVILTKSIYNLGEAGDICEVKNGYARNYLLPKKFAIKASDGSTKALNHQKKLIDKQKAKRQKEIQEIFNILNEKEINIKAKTASSDKLFGSVTNVMIANLIKENFNLDIDKRKIELSESIKTLGLFNLKIKLSEKFIPKLKLNVTSEEEQNNAT